MSREDALIAGSSDRMDADETQERGDTDLFVFEFAQKKFAIPLNYVEEVIEARGISDYPGTAPHCVGTINQRGRVLPIFDSHDLAFKRTSAGAVPACVVIVNVDGVYFGLTFDRHLALIENYAAQPLPDKERVADASIEENQFSLGMRAYDDGTMVLLSPGGLCSVVARYFGTQHKLDPARELGDDAADTQLASYVLSQIGGTIVAHPVHEVLEVVEGLDVMPLFGVEAALRGLASLRGQVIACFDISEFLGLPTRVLDDRSVFLLLSTGSAEFALCVDGVMGIRSLRSTIFHDVAGLLSSPAEALFGGAAECDGETFLRLSASAIVDWENIAPLINHAAER